MSSTTTPISPTRFAAALPSLSLSSLHDKAAELRNSILHLRRSNAQLAPFAADGDADCAEAIAENEGVMERMRERVELLREEVEGRGARWVGWDEEGAVRGLEGREEGVDGEGVVNGVGGGVEDEGGEGEGGVEAVRGGPPRGGGLSDEEIARRMRERMGGDEVDGEDGMHL